MEFSFFALLFLGLGRPVGYRRRDAGLAKLMVKARCTLELGGAPQHALSCVVYRYYSSVTALYFILPQIQIQIQILIESLHTRLDETDEMTNTALLEGGKRRNYLVIQPDLFLERVRREPRAMLAALHSP